MRPGRAPALGPGTYLLVLRLDRAATVRVGALGRWELAPGYYLYLGSALGPGGLGARLRHHRWPARRPHWHVDYLRRRAALTEVWYSEQRRRHEHEWAGVAAALPGAGVPVAGFGASDCRCPAHLIHLATPPRLAEFRALLRQRLPGDPEPRSLGLADLARRRRAAARRTEAAR